MVFWIKNCGLPTFPCLMVLVILVLFTSQTMAASRIGLVKTYDPSATVTRQGQESQLFEGAEIYEGDTIVTDDDGSVGITFEDGAVLTLGASGKIIIESFLFKPDRKEGSFISKIKTGSIAFVSGRINKISPGSVQFITPTATLGLRGTKILIEVK
jgi:hypothetical protein